MPAPEVIDFEVELPAGGVLHLQTADEVQFWEDSADRYEEEYTLAKQNDKITLGQLLQQQIILFRCQTAINGMEPETDEQGVPTGRYRRVSIDGGELMAFQKAMQTASAEMRALEKQLGIDKATREQGGTHTVDSYIKALKRAAHARGVHISKRMIEYEAVIREAEVRWRLLYNADAEDRAYHDISAKTVCDWFKGELERLREIDRKFNQEIGSVFVGKL